MKRLSVIVPVFNVEPYLRKCVASLLDQDIDKSDYEIILIDDGSMDGSGQICDEQASLHDNIQVIHQPNGGLSAARNTGINAARGKYIQFVDSDDYLSPHVLRSLLTRMEADDLDVLRFNYQFVGSDGSVVQPYKEAKAGVDYREDIVSGKVFLEERLGSACYACQFITKASIIRNSQITFTPGVLFEDVIWTPDVLLSASKVSSSKVIVYNYLIRNDSITKNTDASHLRKVLDSLLLIIEHLKKKQDSSGLNWFPSMIASTCITYMNTVALNMYGERRTYIKKIKNLNVLPSHSRMGTRSGRRKLRLINLSPSLFCFVLHNLHR